MGGIACVRACECACACLGASTSILEKINRFLQNSKANINEIEENLKPYIFNVSE